MISILYVDDDPSLLEISKLYLEEMGEFRIDTAESARRALDILRHRTYDAIISDFQMPEMDGIEFLKIMRETFPPLPFILFSGKSRDEIAVNAFENGADVVLQKGGDPRVQFMELSHCIRKSVEHYQSRQALKEHGTRLRQYIQNASDLIGILDTGGCILYDSPKTPQLFGYPEHFLIGKCAIDLVHPDDRESVIAAFRGVRNRIDQETPIGFRLRKADGMYIDAAVVAMNFIGVDGVDGIVVITWPVGGDAGVLRNLHVHAN